MDRAKGYYESVFNVNLERLISPVPDIEMFAFPMAIDRTGASGAPVKMLSFSPGGKSTLVYFSCEDCSVEAARVVSSGGKIVKEKVPIGEYGFMALAYDSEGNMFGLHSLN